MEGKEHLLRMRMLGLEQLTLMLQCNNSKLRRSNATAVTMPQGLSESGGELLHAFC